MSSEVVALGQPTVGEAELKAIAEVFASGWLAGAGPTCQRFEERFAAVAGTAHALATNNCGSALHLAMLTLGVQPGDELIVGDYTFPATGHAVMYAGAKPVFADIRPDIWTIDPASVEALITPRTRGIVAVDVAAAIMLAQLDRLPLLLRARQHIAGRYAELLRDFELIELPVALDDRTHPWQAYIITINKGIDRGEVAQRLRARGVQCNFGTYASHVQPLYGKTNECPVSADLFGRHLAIPMHANLTEAEIETVAAAVRTVVTDVAQGV
jgi:dTDP-4-amino-4,6-dideoxygalactose transaminase